MNEILEHLSKRPDSEVGKPEGIDALLLDAINLRLFQQAIDASGSEEFERSFVGGTIVIGVTYAIVLKICKLYERRKNHNINSLRELYKKIGNSGTEHDRIMNELDTQNEESLFSPLVTYRDKVLAHNESKSTITWMQMDEALFFLSRVWYLIDQKVDSTITQPYHTFENAFRVIEKSFSSKQKKKMKAAWNKYVAHLEKAKTIEFGT